MARSTAELRSVKRMRVLLAFVMLLMLVLAGRMVWVQGIDSKQAAADALSSRTTKETLHPVRGRILDRNGEVLAMSVVRYDIIVNQNLVADEFARKNPETGQRETITSEQAAEEVAYQLGKDPDEVRDLMLGIEGERKNGYSVIAKNVTPKVRDEVMRIGFPWMSTEQRAHREYPNGPIAGQVLGFTNAEGKGATGIELSQQKHLEGIPGERVYERSADGVRIPGAALAEKEAVNGQDVQLSIDQDIQWAAQEAVMSKRKQFNALWVNAIVMDVKTGRILAIADSTPMDPNDPAETEADYRTSAAVSQAIEPGSTGKIPTFALAYEQGKLKPEENFKVPNKKKIGNELISDSLPHATFDMTGAGIFARSYNTGTVMIGERLKDKDRYEFMKKLGIGSSLDVGLGPGNPGILVKPESWDRRQRLTTMFGQGYSLSPMNTASMFQAIANGGERITPTIVDNYIDAEGNKTKAPTGEKQRVVSKDTSQKMLRTMESVVEHGTAQAMKMPGYRVAGKTGTAQAQGPSGKFDQHSQAFGGVVPADDPQYLVLVTMHHPKGNWKDWSVGDTFTSIMEATVRSRGLAPSDAKSKAYKVFTGEKQNYGW